MAKDLQTRLDEAEAAAMQGGRKIVQKMEQVSILLDSFESWVEICGYLNILSFRTKLIPKFSKAFINSKLRQILKKASGTNLVSF